MECPIAREQASTSEGEGVVSPHSGESDGHPLVLDLSEDIIFIPESLEHEAISLEMPLEVAPLAEVGASTSLPVGVEVSLALESLVEPTIPKVDEVPLASPKTEAKATTPKVNEVPLVSPEMEAKAKLGKDRSPWLALV